MLSEREKFNSSTTVGFPPLFCVPILSSMCRLTCACRRSSAGGVINPGLTRFFIPDACSVQALLRLSYVDLQGGLTE
jgi:hypothetical protein